MDTVETVVTDARNLLDRLGSREQNMAAAVNELNQNLTALGQLQQTLLNRITTITNAGKTLNDNVQILADKIDQVSTDSVEMKTRLEAIEASLEGVRQTVVQLLDEGREDTAPITTTPPPEQG